MVYFPIMIRMWRGAPVVALLVAVPLAAAAQADVHWNPLLLKSGEPLSELAPARPAVFEGSNPSAPTSLRYSGHAEAVAPKPRSGEGGPRTRAED